MTLPERLLLMGLGWLARKETLCCVQERSSLKLACKALPNR